MRLSPSAGLGLLSLALHLAAAPRYGWHRDELYLLACGQRLAWGGVDHAPLAPALSRLQALVLGPTAAGQRVADAVAVALVAWLTGRFTRRLGGDRAAEAWAAGSVVIAPVFWWAGGVHGTLAFDQLAWLCAGLLVCRLAEAARPRDWILLGLVMGLGFLNKHTILLGAAACGLALVTSPARRALASPWPWLGVGLALVVASPDLLWQAAHRWPAVDFAQASREAIAARTPRFMVLLAQPRLLHPLGFVVAVAGLLAGAQRGAPPALRAGTTLMVAGLLLVTAVGGKPYYAAPFWPLALAAGATVLTPRLSSTARRVVAGAWVLGGVAVGLSTLPLLPPAIQHRWGLTALHPDLVQFADWQEVARQILAVQRPDERVLTDSYGTAAALERYDPLARLPLSGANSWWQWGPGEVPDGVLAVGYPRALLERIFLEVAPAGEVRHALGLDNRFDFPRTIYRCRGWRRPVEAVWPELRRFD